MPLEIPNTGVAIDAGSKQSAYVEFQLNDAVLSGFDVLSMDKVPNEDLRELLRRGFSGMLVIEMPKPRGMPTSAEEMEMMCHVGRFIQVWSHRGGRWSYSHRQYVKLFLCGRLRGVSDSNVRRAMIDMFGGDDEAIGGVKCPRCKGSGVYGFEIVTCPECTGAGEVPAKKAGATKKCPTCHGRKTVKGERATCDTCRGQTWRYPPGPLFGTIGKPDIWSALGIAALWASEPIVIQRLGSSQVAKLQKTAERAAAAIRKALKEAVANDAKTKISGRP